MNTSNLRSTKLSRSVTAALMLMGLSANALASTMTVTSCADDDSGGTLRQVAAAAASGDTLDLSGLSCDGSTITLAEGEIVLTQDAKLVGSTSNPLTITNSSGRILHSTSSGGYLGVANLKISGGRIITTGDAYGGCIAASGNVALIGTQVSDCAVNSADGMAVGGAVSAQSVNLVMSSVSGNTAAAAGAGQLSRGGGIYATSISCIDSSVSGNMALATSDGTYAQGGGAIIVGGDASFQRCTIDSNAAGVGGGVMQLMFNGGANSSVFKDSTISGNTATSSFGGVDVFCPDCTAAPVQLFNSTVAFNSSLYGGAVGTNGSVAAESSIFAANAATQSPTSADVYAIAITGADNLVMSTNAAADTGVVTVTTDPQLMSLADNGGPTRTHAFALSSSASNQGNNTAQLATDQRGFAREAAGGLVDIGAYQAQHEDQIFRAAFQEK
jgi:hypothetical protein